VQPPEAFLSRGLEVHPHGRGDDLELWLDPRYVPAGYGWSFPADRELRVGVGSFDPRRHVKDPTLQLARDVDVPAERFQGNWIPHKLRKAVDDGVFLAGDSAGHCLPVTAEGIRTALYFGLACGRELREVVEGRRTREEALARYAAFNDGHARTYLWLKRVQNLVGRINPTPVMPVAARAFRSEAFTRWAFNHYLAIAPPQFATAPAASPGGRRPDLAPAA
jgi:flavin-dependent dehydrogenase